MEGIGSDEKKSLVDTFTAITSASADEALFFLESHAFQLEPAIHSFYENTTNQGFADPAPEHDEDEEPADAAAAPSAIPSLPVVSPPPSARMSSREDQKKKAPSRPSGSRGGIHTLADLNQSAGQGSDDDDSDEPQEYYTGGEKSGMLVQDPKKGGRPDVDALFAQAREMGATQAPPPTSSSSRSFTGTGRLLSGESVHVAPAPPENVVHNIVFWNNGFTIGDGPLRRFDDPANAAFLESIKRSECPKELEPENRRTQVHVNLMKREEDCPEPVVRKVPFQGMGRTLGGGSSSESVPQQPTSSTPAAPAAPVVVDVSKPTTSLQLRLADGSRTVARFNTDHTVADIRAFIDNHMATSGRGSGVVASYTLQTVGFPPKQLTDLTLTIAQAGLANSVLIQKL